MKTICVYCGSSDGHHKSYRESAAAFGALLAQHGMDLVYGGGDVGLMGAVADAVMSKGRKVTGIIPQSLVDMEVAHHQITELRVVQTMHERKQLMADLSDGFVALPGGIGTLEELFEVFTWAQLGFHHKPIGILNINGFYDPLLKFLRQVVETGFLKQAHLDALVVAESGELLLQAMRHSPPVPERKWVE